MPVPEQQVETRGIGPPRRVQPRPHADAENGPRGRAEKERSEAKFPEREPAADGRGGGGGQGFERAESGDGQGLLIFG